MTTCRWCGVPQSKNTFRANLAIQTGKERNFHARRFQVRTGQERSEKCLQSAELERPMRESTIQRRACRRCGVSQSNRTLTFRDGPSAKSKERESVPRRPCEGWGQERRELSSAKKKQSSCRQVPKDQHELRGKAALSGKEELSFAWQEHQSVTPHQIGLSRRTLIKVGWVQGRVRAGSLSMILCSGIDKKEVSREVFPFLVSFWSDAR